LNNFTDNVKPAALETIVGDKIILRPITMEDTPLIVKWRNTESVRSNFIYRGEFTEAVHTNWMNTKVASGEVVQYIIVDRQSGHSVGSVYFRDINHEYSSAEYGMFIGEAEARGKGIGSEAARIFSDFGFEKLGLHRISLRILGDNEASINSCRKAGFDTEGLFRDMVKLDGRYCDVVFMARLSDRKENA